jgi:hypothetical protein
MLKQTNFFGRSVLPQGDTGAAVTVPADVRRDQDLTPGEDIVDLEYNREENTLTIHFQDS